MQISLVALAALIVLIGAVSRGQLDVKPKKEELVVDSEIEEFEDELDELEDVLAESDDTLEASSEPLVDDVVYTNTLSDYIYADSEIISQNAGFLDLKSGSDTDVITDWYKAVIRKNGFMAKSFVSTSTNGEILNKLEAAGEDIKISIEIIKSPGSAASIKVKLTQ